MERREGHCPCSDSPSGQALPYGGAHPQPMDMVYWMRRCRYRYRIREAEQLAQVTRLTDDRAGVEPFGACVLLSSVTLPSLLTPPSPGPSGCVWVSANLHQLAGSRGRRGLGAPGTCLAQQHWPCLHRENVPGSKQPWHSIFLLSCTIPGLFWESYIYFCSHFLTEGRGWCAGKVLGIREAALRDIPVGALAGPWGLGLDGRSFAQL